MDESLYREFHRILSERERDRGSYAPSDVMESIVDDKIRRLLEWLADKSDELEGIND
jgi:hypothetical protein